MRIPGGLFVAIFGAVAHAAEMPPGSSAQVIAGGPSLPAMPAVAYLPPDRVPKLAAPPKHYAAPPGFAGHRWGELRSTFGQLPEPPAGVSAAWSQGRTRDLEMICSGAVGGCGLDDYIRAARTQVVDGAGFHVLSEYYIETQGYRFPVVRRASC